MEYNLIGQVLGGRYEILEVIGSGGMATVYKARCRLLNRYVAIKVLKESLKNDMEVVKRFSTESRAAASLSHHNIVSVYDVGETENGLNYIVMEYIDGVTLKEYINRKYRLDWREACEFAYQIAMALECAHEHGIIHRDIKPHNILLTKDHTLKVADFGIARTTGSDTVVASGNNPVFGSVHYISPEQARGGYVDAGSDVYSLGVVLYEMLTGKVPFNGENPVSVALMKLENDPEDVRNIVPDIPDAVAEIVMKAIAKEQYIRYQSAADMAFDLREALDDGARQVKPVKRGVREATDMKKKKQQSKGGINKNVVLTAVILAVVLGVASYLFFSGGRKEMLVPNLMDKTLEEAIPLAEEAGFKIDEDKITYAVSEEYEEGKIMKQTPGANTYVKSKKIKITVSSGNGAGDIEVPSVVGLDYTKATEALRVAKLKYRKIEESSSDYDEGEVIRQTPKSGTKVTENYVVILHVSTGAPEETTDASDEANMVPVPKLTGTTLEGAETLIKSAKLKIGKVTKEESDKPEGTVISQSPKAGSESAENGYVNLVVSAGKAEEEPAETTEPTKKPASPTTAPTPAPTQQTQKKTLTIQLPQTESGTVNVRVVANGTEIYNKQHQCSEGEVDITVAAKKDALVEVYFDGVLSTTKVVEF